MTHFLPWPRYIALLPVEVDQVGDKCSQRSRPYVNLAACIFTNSVDKTGVKALGGIGEVGEAMARMCAKLCAVKVVIVPRTKCFYSE